MKPIDEACIVIEPKVFYDDRGYFFETYSKRDFEKKLGFQSVNFCQQNESCSAKGVIRGLHWQNDEHAQAKLVRVIRGAVVDFALDIREGSPTYGKMKFVELTGDNKKQFYIPRGFAHGFVSLEDDTVFAYQCDNYYCKESEGGYHILSPKLNIIGYLKDVMKIQLDVKKLIFSEKDLKHPIFE